MPFARVLGQDKPKQIIAKALKHNSVPHTYLFFGPESIGKKLAAIELAKALNCRELESGDNCGHCASCRKIEQRTHPDFILLEPQKSTPLARQAVIKIEAVRNLQKKLSFLPYEGKTKVAVIDGAESMTPEAASSFLKTLEEPPSSTVLILITSNPFLLLPTIVSRCQGVKFHPLSTGQVKEIICGIMEIEGIEIPPEELEPRAVRSMGGINRALEEDVLETGKFREELVDLIDKASFDQMDVVFQWSKTYARQTERLPALLDELMNLIRDLAVLKSESDPEYLYNRDLLKKLKPLSEKKSFPALLKIFDSVQGTRLALSANANVQLSLETMLIRFCEAA